MIVDGADDASLRVGLGHVSGTAQPGKRGNIAIAGHRDTFFRSLHAIERNDEITLETATQTYRYHVVSIQIVQPDDVAVLRSSGQDELTLITCYPFSYFGNAPKRFVVQATLAQ